MNGPFGIVQLKPQEPSDKTNGGRLGHVEGRENSTPRILHSSMSQDLVLGPPAAVVFAMTAGAVRC